jgi:molybdopterin/thiamine biosynthesis adenylyltransferase
MGTLAQGQPCYRCLFEDLPGGEASPNCAEAGVMGPVVGFAGALMADVALSLLRGVCTRAGAVYSYDGLVDKLRRVDVSPRASCPLCGEEPTILDTPESLYLEPHCAA